MVFLSSAPRAKTEGMVFMDGEKNGNRHISAGTPDLSRHIIHHPHHRIISPQMDIPVVGQKIVGNAVKFFKKPP
jgi:hypothetical protein